MRGPAFFAYADNYLIDVKFGIIMDVEASRAIRQAEVGAAKAMIERTEERFDIKPERLAADTAHGSARTRAKTEAFEQSRGDRKRVEMLFAHLKRILKLGRLRLRGPRGAQDEFTLAAIAQNLRRLAKLAAQPPPIATVCVG